MLDRMWLDTSNSPTAFRPPPDVTVVGLRGIRGPRLLSAVDRTNCHHGNKRSADGEARNATDVLKIQSETHVVSAAVQQTPPLKVPNAQHSDKRSQRHL